MATDTKTETDNIKTKYSSVFGISGDADDNVGYIGTIVDDTYNTYWIICAISGNTYYLFPMRNLGSHRMNPTDTTEGGYYKSDMYTHIHNTVLPNLRKSGLNIIACDLVSKDLYHSIVSRTLMTSGTITDGEPFWLTDTASSIEFCNVCKDGSIFSGNTARHSLGVRPLITVVKN